MGLSKASRTTTWGSSAGATPRKETIRSPVVSSRFSDVPVLPPMLYPAILAFLPVPVSTTSRRILHTVAEVCSLTTWRTSLGWVVEIAFPSLSVTDWTR